MAAASALAILPADASLRAKNAPSIAVGSSLSPPAFADSAARVSQEPQQQETLPGLSCPNPDGSRPARFAQSSRRKAAARNSGNLRLIPTDLQPIFEILNGVMPGDNLDRALAPFRQSLDAEKAGRMMEHIESPALALLFFDWVRLRVGHSVFSCNCALRMLCRHNRHQQALELFKNKMAESDASTYDILIRGFFSAGDVEVAMQLLDEMKGKGYDSKAVQTTLMNGLCDAERVSEALVCFKITSRDCTLDPETYSALILALCKAGLVDEAHSVLHEMIAKGYIPEMHTTGALVCKLSDAAEIWLILEKLVQEGAEEMEAQFETVIRKLCKSRKIALAAELLGGLVQKDFPPTVLMFNVIINAFCKREDLEAAYWILELMLQGACTPNFFTFSVLINGLCKAGMINEARELLEKMAEVGCAPNTAIYNTVMDGFRKQEQLDDVILLFRLMEERDCPANIVTHSILIDAFCKAERFEEARQQLVRMIQDGCSPDVVTYNSLLDAACNLLRIDDACELFSSMLDQDFCSPSPVTYNILLNCFASVGRITDACWTLEMLIELRSLSGLRACTGLIDEMCRSSRAVEAVQLVEVMSNAGFLPDASTITAVLKGLFAEGYPEKASEFFELMVSRGGIHDACIYNTVINGFIRAGNCDRACLVIHQGLDQQRKELLPGASTMASLVDSLCEAGHSNAAWQLLNSMAERRNPAAVSAYNRLISGLLRVGREAESCEVFKVMLTNGPSPEISTLNIVISWLCAASRVGDAYALVELMSRLGSYPDIQTCNTLISGYYKTGRIDLARKLLDEMREAGLEPSDATYDALDGG